MERWEVIALGVAWAGVTMAWLTAMKGLWEVTWEAARRYEYMGGLARLKLRLVIQFGLAGFIFLLGAGILAVFKSVFWIWQLW